MRTQKNESIKIKHSVADVDITPKVELDNKQIQELFFELLDEIDDNRTVSADVVIDIIKKSVGDKYDTAGYNLRVYRNRADLTQVALAKLAGIKQHHLSEMENNKRTIGRKLAMRLSEILKINYKELM